MWLLSIGKQIKDNLLLSFIKENTIMKVALGIHVGHDRGACIIKDGFVIAAIANERLDRIKHSNSTEIPYQSIDALLKYCNLTIEDISTVGLSAVAIEDNNAYNHYKKDFFLHYGCQYKPFYFIHHHEAHAYSVFYSSGFKNALIFVFDGGGDFVHSHQESETIFYAQGDMLTTIDKRLQDLAIRHMKDKINNNYDFMPKLVRERELSLARKYSQFTHLLGFDFGQEGKTMGLASYGTPLIDCSNLNYQSLNFSLKYRDLLEEIYCIQQFSGKCFDKYVQENRADIASTVQCYIENAVISLIQSYTKKFGIKNICVSGGLFLNCLTNHKILERCDLENVYMLPASGDDGQALGAAYFAYLRQFGYEKPFDINLPYLGLSYTDEQIEDELKHRGIPYQKLEQSKLISKTAHLICENKIIAIHRGKSEIGPRALCHRSIIANPTNPEMKDILNHRVKHREPFRPFAPTVAAENQFDYFDLKTESPYMLLATTVKEEHRASLAAITHIDNTARIQSVTKSQEPFIHQLLMEMKTLTGYSVILNTSFNVAGQPIVESPYDALETFLNNDIDVLVIGSFLIDKSIM